MRAAPKATSPLDRLREYADIEVRHRSIPLGPMYLVLFVAILSVTPITRRFPAESAVFGGTLAALSVALIAFCLRWKKAPSSESGYRSRVFRWVLHMTGAVFGAFCGFTIAAVELSWTSFFVIMITCGISSGMASVLAPNFSLLRTYLALMLGPSFLINLLIVGGLRGYALAAFFGGFGGLLYWVGKLQNTSYWENSSRRARLQAMVDAIPGTLAWVSHDLKYLGLNKRTAELWRRHPAEFVGKPVGAVGSDPELVSFTQRLFSSAETQATCEIERIVEEKPRNFFLVGTKYNLDTEAVVIGLDVTDYKAVVRELAFQKEELARQREQVRATAKFAMLGEIAANVADELGASIDGSVAETAPDEARAIFGKVNRLQKSLKHVLSVRPGSTADDLSVAELVEDLLALFAARFKKHGVRMVLPDVSSVSLRDRRVPAAVLPILLQIWTNAFEAVQGEADRWVKLAFELRDAEIELQVTDSGSGVPSELSDRIFDPLFTTKNLGETSGSGLKVARALAEELGGSLTLDLDSAHTRFVVRIPV